MPITVGLLPTQQESFAHHEELSKLLHESDVFYVPLQHDFTNHQDLSDLTKRFDEDILNKHLVVTFRDIGYSLFLNSVESVRDQHDQSKIKISGKMIVDGICIQFLGSFDSRQTNRTQTENQQINGVGRICLDEDYYRELSSEQISFESEYADEKILVEQQHRCENLRRFPMAKPRSRTISENILTKQTTNHHLNSPPSSTATRSRIHSPSHMPYQLRSPRTITHVNKQQRQTSSPINVDNSSKSRSSGFQSSLISPSSSEPSSFNENPIDTHPIQFLSTSLQFPSNLNQTKTLPIQIPSSNSDNHHLPANSLPQLTGIFPMTQSHSLPTYFVSHTNLAYFTANPNTNMFFITNSNSHPLHLITSMDRGMIPISNPNFPSSSYVNSTMAAQIVQESSMASSPGKRAEQEDTKVYQMMDTSKQNDEQLPLKKRRYTGQPSPNPMAMETSHFDDEEASNESMKK